MEEQVGEKRQQIQDLQTIIMDKEKDIWTAKKAANAHRTETVLANNNVTLMRGERDAATSRLLSFEKQVTTLKEKLRQERSDNGALKKSHATLKKLNSMKDVELKKMARKAIPKRAQGGPTNQLNTVDAFAQLQRRMREQIKTASQGQADQRALRRLTEENRKLRREMAVNAKRHAKVLARMRLEHDERHGDLKMKHEQAHADHRDAKETASKGHARKQAVSANEQRRADARVKDLQRQLRISKLREKETRSLVDRLSKENIPGNAWFEMDRQESRARRTRESQLRAEALEARSKLTEVTTKCAELERERDNLQQKVTSKATSTRLTRQLRTQLSFTTGQLDQVRTQYSNKVKEISTLISKQTTNETRIRQLELELSRTKMNSSRSIIRSTARTSSTSFRLKLSRPKVST